MPTCPRCGGATAKQLAPGYFECESTWDEDVCGHRYQEGGAALGENSPICHCGTFAIGKCAECGIWVCGAHSSISTEGEQRLCSEHYQAALRRQYAAEEERRRPIREERERKRREAEAAEKKRARNLLESAVAGVVIAPVVGWLGTLLLGIEGIFTWLIPGAVFGAAVENYRFRRNSGWPDSRLPSISQCIWGGGWGSFLGLVIYLLN